MVKDTERPADHRSLRTARLPGLRRHAREDLAGLRRPDAGGRRPGHLRLHLRRPRQPRAGARVGAGRGRLPGPAAVLRPGLRRLLRAPAGARDRQAQHALRLHRRRERPLRRRRLGPTARGATRSATSAAGQLCRLPVQPDRRGQRQPRVAAARRRARLRGPLRLGADRLRQRQPAADRPRRCASSSATSAATKAHRPVRQRRDPTPITRFLVDPVDEKTLHMVNADPRRTPTFTLFANPDYFLSTFNCPAAGGGGPVCIDYHFAWSHGDVARTTSAGSGSAWSDRACATSARRAASGPTTPTCGRRCSRCSA